jgi:DNA-binding NarL/FixJ family response regulator
MTKRLRPDIVLMDIGMPCLDGAKATLRISQEAPSVRVVILTMYRDEDHAFTSGWEHADT